MAERKEYGGAHVRREEPEHSAAPKKRGAEKKTAPAQPDERPVKKHSQEKKAAPAQPDERTQRKQSRASAERARRRERFEEGLAAAPEAPKKKRRPSAKKRRRARRMRNTLIVLLSLLIALIGGGLYAGASVSGSTTNLPNVYLRGIAVGGLTEEQTEARLKAQGWEEETSVPLTVTLPGEVQFEVNRIKAGAVLSARRMAENAFRYGHSGHWIADLSSYVKAMMNPVDLGEISSALDGTYILAQMQSGLDAFDALKAERGGYTVDKERELLRLYKGADTLRLDRDKLYNAVVDTLLAGDTALNYTALEGEPIMPDFNVIYQALAVEPRDASYVPETWEVVDEVVGCTFSVEQAEERWNAAAPLGEVAVPLTITYPEVTGEQLRSVLFRDILGTQTTYFPYSVPNRVSNINLACSILNGIVLLPGQSLSYNETLGQRTEEAGFLPAGAYSDGEVVEEVGGGICQVSSTLYCAEVMANLETVNRTNHYFRVDYLPIGFDATVSWPGPDFVFRNNRDYPIKIVAYCDTVERYLTIEIWGTNVDGTHVEMRNNGVYTVYDPVYTATAVGTATTTYRDLYDAEGNLIATTQERYSDYHKHAEDIDWPPEKYAADAAAESGEAEVMFG